MRHLHRLPVDIVKVDRAYLDEAAVILGPLRQLFAALGVTAVTEVIEAPVPVGV